MSNIIDLTNIQKYNDLIAAASNRKVKHIPIENRTTLANAAIMGKFTLSKQVEQDEKTFINFICDIGNYLGASYVNFGTSGIALYFNRDKTSTYEQRYSIDQYIRSSFQNVQIQQTLLYNHKTQRAETVPVMASGAANNYIRTIQTAPSSSKAYSLVYIELNYNHVWATTFLCTDSINYGLYDIPTKTCLHTKKSDLINFNYQRGFLSQSSIHPNPVDIIEGVDAIVLLKDALNFINAVQNQTNREWKAFALKCIMTTFRKFRWPSQKAFLQNISNIMR